ncbi:hypothetical protein Purlil1_222 [Purpureocillium lilacinum]|uniref:Uncharacterized protein n=1 Tax=Purpureocillium lilacinum TaxID=33203 RepID=A0ABR0CG81_PURLI|nr:hypothetical protein Purlil1_222 [Purpureocillium lilacinum]
METLISIAQNHQFLFHAQDWKDGLFRNFGQGLDVLVHQLPSILHIAKAAIMLHTLALLLHGLFFSCRQGTDDLPKPAVDGKRQKKNARRVKVAVPLGPVVSWHFTLKVSRGDRVVKTGVSLGPFKIMAVVTLGKDRNWRSVWETTNPQAKLYGSAFFIKGSTAVL